MTFCSFDTGAGDKSACNDPCAANRPASKATDAAAPSGWSIITRENGTRQWPARAGRYTPLPSKLIRWT